MKDKKISPESSKLNKEVDIASPRKYPAYLTLSEDELPAIKDWKVGQTYEVRLKIKQISSSIGNEWEIEQGKKPAMTARFMVEKVDCCHDKAEAPVMKRTERLEKMSKAKDRY